MSHPNPPKLPFLDNNSFLSRPLHHSQTFLLATTFPMKQFAKRPPICTFDALSGWKAAPRDINIPRNNGRVKIPSVLSAPQSCGFRIGAAKSPGSRRNRPTSGHAAVPQLIHYRYRGDFSHWPALGCFGIVRERKKEQKSTSFGGLFCGSATRDPHILESNAGATCPAINGYCAWTFGA